MIKNIEHYLFHEKNFLDKEYCDNCVNELKNEDWKKHSWYAADIKGDYAPSGNNEPEELRYWFGSGGTDHGPDFSKNVHTMNAFIIEKIHSSLLEYYNKLDFHWFTDWSGYLPLKFLRYFPDQKLENHCDQITLGEGVNGIPLLSVIGMLNDNYEGGELIFFKDKKINFEKGDILIFPSTFLYPHQVSLITKGIRYSYVTWVY